MKLRLIENENLKEYSDNPEPEYEDEVRVPVEVQATFQYTIEVPKSVAEGDNLEEYIDEEVQRYFPDDYDNYEITDVDYHYISKADYEANRADEYNDEQRLMDDSEEATQPQDIPKKVEYKKMVTPDFKVGSKI